MRRGKRQRSSLTHMRREASCQRCVPLTLSEHPSVSSSSNSPSLLEATTNFGGIGDLRAGKISPKQICYRGPGRQGQGWVQ